MKRGHRSILVAGAMLGLCAFATEAAVLPASATLSGDQEVPPTGSTATGVGSFTLDTTARTINNLNLTVQGIFLDDLVGVGEDSTPAHIHEAPPGVNGGIRVEFLFDDIEETPTGFEINIDSIDLDPVLDEFPSFLASLLAGNTYFNVHTESFGGGEIRGQINVVPIPAGLVLLGSALGGLGWIAHRRKV